MFTVGREKEKEHARRYLRDPSNFPSIEAVIDAVHDCIEGNANPDKVSSVIANSFLTGGSGVW